VSHNSYLINLASPDAELWEKSIAAQRAELERCERLHIPLCVMHPGAHLGESSAAAPRRLGAAPTKHEFAGLERIARALNRLHRELPGYRTLTCLETTVGAGSSLGYDFGHLAALRGALKQPERVGYCFDTCHVTAAGYDMSTSAAAAAVLRHWDATCGLQNIRVFHFNDSAGACGSRRDRHIHIGDGFCGKSCFQAILNHPALRLVPKILETPKEKDSKGRDWDIVNIQRLKRLARSARDSSKPPSRKGRIQSADR
jgi:deoxyribonuclease-4